MLLDAIFLQKEEQIANEIFGGQDKALMLSLSDIQAVQGILNTLIYDMNGRLIQSATIVDSGPFSETDRNRLNHHPLFVIHDDARHPAAEYASQIEVMGEKFGYIRILYDLSDIKRERHQAYLLFAALLIAILVMISIFLNLLLTYLVIKPSSAFVDAIKRLQEGHFGEQVAVMHHDELGQVALAFNDMSLKLKNKHAELLEAVHTREEYAIQVQKANLALEKLNIKLEERVTDRTAALTESNEQLQKEILEKEHAYQENRDLQERLARSHKMEALGLLAGGVAHDLNNVLSGIVSYPDLLLMDLPDGHPMRKPILTIQSSGLKAAAIVQDLLTLARRGVVNMKPVNLNDIIVEYLNSPEHARLLSYHHDVQVVHHLAPDLMNIGGSAIHLRKTVMNLVSNAAESQPSGGQIILHTENRYLDAPVKGYDTIKSGDYVVFTIQDFGYGISSGDTMRIFEPFYTKKVMGRSGTGLGMAVVWGTIQDHHGYIDVNSIEGEGTTFELYFPIIRESVPDADVQIPIDAYRGNGESILVIDDMPEQREIALEILKKLGYRVSAVSSGEDAIHYLDMNPVDLVVLDMIMDPGMDGLETYQKIIKNHAGQKAVIASGFAEDHRVKEALRLGAGAYVRKPYSLEKIGIAVRDTLAGGMRL
jgi:signal transduction histidine kinase